MKKKSFRWLKIFVLFYCIIGIALYYGQNGLLFHPQAVSRQLPYDLGAPYREVNLSYDKETNLNILQIRADSTTDTTRGVVLYFHGNKNNSAYYAASTRGFTRKGYEVWMLDYPGFGKSTGKLTEENLYKYALVFYKLARSRWSPSQIIICGRSLGTGVAAQLASIRDCRRLILESPYYSLTALAQHYAPIYPVKQMLHYHFPTNEYLKEVTAPVTIFHGDRDGLIPYSNSVRLKALLKPGDELITIEGAGHKDLTDPPFFQKKLDSVLEH